MARRRYRHSRSRGVLIRNRYSTLVAAYYMTQSTQDWRNWGYRSMSQAKAEELERDGKADRVIRQVDQEVRDAAGQVIGSEKVVMTVGFRLKEPLRCDNTSPTSLNVSVSRAASGEFARGDRPTRGERARIAKYKVWNEVGDTKAPIARNRTPDGERRQAESLLGFHGTDAALQAEKQLARRKR